jgi:regulator of replication initiation timing
MSNGGVSEPSPGGGFTPPSSVDPNEYAQMQQKLRELEQYQQETQSVFDQLSPHSARIKRMVEDENAARLFDDSLASYEALSARNKPKLSDEWNPEVNPWLKKIDAMYDQVQSFAKESTDYKQQAQEQVNQRLLQENTKLSEQLIEKFPHLAESDYAGIKMIASYGIQNKMSFADAASALEPAYKRERSVEPTLRTNVGAPGVPAASDNKMDNVDLVARATELIRGEQRKAGMAK